MIKKPLNQDLIITGIPRSGTTLACTLINNLANSVCLSEPNIVDKFIAEAQSVNEYIQLLEEEFTSLRNHVWYSKQILNKQSQTGEQITNYYTRDKSGQLKANFKIGEEKVDINDKNFILAMKHNAHFMSILPQLVETTRFSIIAIVRNPVPTILSWRSLSIPISKGRLPAAEKFWPVIHKIWISSEKILFKQLMIYEQFCRRLLDMKDHIWLVKYEDIIKEKNYFENILGQKSLRQVVIRPRDVDSYHNAEDAQLIFQYLEKYAPSAFQIYTALMPPE